MSATHKSDWYWSDWLGDQEVRRLTPAERGVWIDLIALAAAGSPTGYVCDGQGRPLSLDEIARVTNAGSVDAVAELIKGILDKGAASRDRAGRLFNRRMVRETERSRQKAALAAKRAEAGRRGADHTNLINHRNRILVQQMPQQLTQHLPREIRYPSSKENKKDLKDAAHAREPPAPCGQPPPSGQAEASQGLQEEGLRRPHTVSRSELEAGFARKRNGS